MIFKETWQQVLDGTKTQTRRPVKEGEECRDGRTVSRYWISRFRFMAPGLNWTYMNPKWRVGHTYAVQPGRGKKSIGRIRITKIRRETLQEISPDDSITEGIEDRRGSTVFYEEKVGHLGLVNKCVAIDQMATILRFKDLWNSLYRKPYRWEDNPEVWVLEFEKVKE